MNIDYNNRIPGQLVNTGFHESNSIEKNSIENSKLHHEMCNDARIDMMQMKPGDVFNAEILDIRNNEVTLVLDDNRQMTAKMQQAFDFNIGQRLLFQLKSNDPSQILIRPVGNGEISQELVSKSLQQAGITNSDKNVAIIKELIENGQPINKQSVLSMLKLSNTYPTEGIDKLVTMSKYGMEINQDSLKQFDDFSTNNHQLNSIVSETADSMYRFIMESAVEKNGIVPEYVVDFFNEISEFENQSKNSINGEFQNKGNDTAIAGNFADKLIDTVNNAGDKADNLSDNLRGEIKNNRETSIAQNAVNNDSNVEKKEAVNNGADLASRKIISESAFAADKIFENLTGKKNSEYSGENISKEDQHKMAGEEKTAANLRMADTGRENIKATDLIMLDTRGDNIKETNPREADTRGDNIKEIILRETELAEDNFSQKKNERNTVSLLKPEGQQIIKNVLEELEKIDNSKDFSKVLKGVNTNTNDSIRNEILMSSQFERAIKRVFDNEFKIDVSDNEIILNQDTLKRVYGKIQKASDIIEKFLGKEDNIESIVNKGTLEKLSSDASNLKNNLQFTNELNNLMQYVQIPMKLSTGDGHGDLYVYNKLKNKKYKEGDALTAFLHFDLKNLGATDIKVCMKGKNVTTEFCLYDKKSWEIVDNHMDELTKRLEKKGYSASLSSELIINESKKEADKTIDHTNVIKEIIENSSGKTEIKRYKFDIRT